MTITSHHLQGFTTYFMKASQEIRAVSYFWKVLESCFSHDVKESVKGIRMSKDNKVGLGRRQHDNKVGLGRRQHDNQVGLGRRQHEC